MKHKITCKHCDSRYVGCHAECVNYLAYREERDELLNKRQEQISKESTIDTYRIDKSVKERRRRK